MAPAVGSTPVRHTDFVGYAHNRIYCLEEECGSSGILAPNVHLDGIIDDRVFFQRARSAAWNAADQQQNSHRTYPMEAESCSIGNSPLPTPTATPTATLTNIKTRRHRPPHLTATSTATATPQHATPPNKPVACEHMATGK